MGSRAFYNFLFCHIYPSTQKFWLTDELNYVNYIIQVTFVNIQVTLFVNIGKKIGFHTQRIEGIPYEAPEGPRTHV